VKANQKLNKQSPFGSVAPTVTDKLRHPSIIEAVCELRFKSGVSYSLVPGAMKERLRDTYPDFEVLPHAAMMAAIPDESALAVPYHRFKRKSPNLLIQTGPRLLTINVLPLYPHFEVYREEILTALDHYKAVADPGSPVRVGLRYINQLHGSDENPQDIASYVRCGFSYPENLTHPPNELAARVLLPYGNFGTLALAISFPSRTPQGEIAATLDMDFYWSANQEFDLSEFPNWLQAAHDIVYKAFTTTVAERLLRKME
jgi:uncharacterized protein (TIGR04255 family)